MPATEIAAATALAPGIGSIRKPAERMAATNAAPGSDTPGVPASVTRATDSPFRKTSDDLLNAGLFVVLVDADDGNVDVEMPEQIAGPPRILGRHQLDRS